MKRYGDEEEEMKRWSDEEGMKGWRDEGMKRWRRDEEEEMMKRWNWRWSKNKINNQLLKKE